MANNFNAYGSTQLQCLGFGLNGDSMSDAVFESQNLVHERSFLASQLLVSSPATCQVHQIDDELTHQRENHQSFALGFGELGLNQRAVTEVRRTFVTPHRVQVHSFVDYSLSQDQFPFIPQGPDEVIITELIRTNRFLSPASTLYWLLAPSDEPFHAHQGFIGSNNYRFGNEIQELLDSPDLDLTPSKQPNFQSTDHDHSYHLTHLHHYHHCDYCLSQSVLGIMNHEYHADHNEAHQQFRNPIHPVSIFESQEQVVLNPQPVSALVPSDTQILGQNQNLGNAEPTPSAPKRRKYRLPKARVSKKPNVAVDNGYEIASDGRTHSLPHPINGPYTCPECKKVFQISQSFAAHMLTHYRYESFEKRKKRLTARNGRKNFQLVH